MIWTSILLTIGLGFGGYLYIHARNNQSHRYSVYKYCSNKVLKEAVADSVYNDMQKQYYELHYPDCIKSN